MRALGPPTGGTHTVREARAWAADGRKPPASAPVPFEKLILRVLVESGVRRPRSLPPEGCFSRDVSDGGRGRDPEEERGARSAGGGEPPDRKSVV